MITEDYVSFETAKLLKEKGFKAWCYKSYGTAVYHKGVPISFDEECELKEEGLEDEIEYVEGGYLYDFGYDNRKKDAKVWAAPTLWMAMKWLREAHKIDITVDPHEVGNNWIYQFHICQNKDYLFSRDIDTSYENCAEAAIKYCLKNLIKNENGEEESNISVPKTVNEAISTLEKILSDEDKEYLLKNGAISMHSSLGRWIRNEWGLWTDSELKNELKKKGVEHPDDMSNYIIEEFIKYWNNKI